MRGQTEFQVNLELGLTPCPLMPPAPCARGGLKDRHRDEIGGCGPDGRGHLTRGVLRRNPPGSVRQRLMDTFLPVVERRDADTELPAELGDAQVRLPLPLELSSPPVDPRLVVRSRFCRSRVDSPDTASYAVRGQPTTPGDNSPGAASHAVQGPGYHARQGWFGRTDTAR